MRSYAALKIISIILVILATVLATGYYAYKGLSSIVNEVSQSSTPDAKLATLKQVLTDVSDASNSVKSYNLTQDVKYLQPFYKSLSMIDQRLEMLDSLSASDSIQTILLDSLFSLIELKYKYMNGLLNLNYNESIKGELGKISETIEETTRKQQTQQIKTVVREVETQSLLPPPPKKKRTIFSRLFGKKEEPTPEEQVVIHYKLPDTTVSIVPDTQKMNIVAEAIKGEIDKVDEEYKKSLQNTRKQELLLTSNDNDVMDKIRVIAAQFENIELALMKDKSILASRKAKRTNRIIMAFCVLLCILLIAVSWTILSYLGKKKRYEKALSLAKTEAENLAQAKANFLANMSHEIRTPMNAIAGFTDLVLQSRLNGEQREQLDIVKKSSNHLLHIVNDILDYSKLQSGKLRFEHIPFRLEEILDEVVVLASSLQKSKEVSIRWEIKQKEVPYLKGDPVRLRQVLINLVGNSVKFTQKGEIVIYAGTSQKHAKAALLHLRVIDTGIGIPPDKLKNVFNEFEQVDNTMASKFGGTGLGLPITKKIIEMQGGSISVESTLQLGTNVKVEIPFHLATDEEFNKRSKEEYTSFSLAGKKILIADDDAYNRKLFATILTKWKVEITEATTGKEALQKVEENNFDIVLMDIRMPEMDGIEACRRLRAMKDVVKSQTPVIAISAGVLEEEVQECKAAGINGFIPKPFKEEELYTGLSQLLQPSGDKKIKNFEMNHYSNIQKPGNSYYDLTQLRQLSNGDDKFFKEMIQLFIDTTKSSVQAMAQALTEERWIDIANTAHQIAASCRHMGAEQLLQLLKLIENNIREQNNTEDIPDLIRQVKKEAEAMILALAKDNSELSLRIS